MRLAVLFGSTATGTEHASSDVDGESQGGIWEAAAQRELYVAAQVGTLAGMLSSSPAAMLSKNGRDGLPSCSSTYTRHEEDGHLGSHPRGATRNRAPWAEHPCSAREPLVIGSHPTRVEVPGRHESSPGTSASKLRVIVR
jgi:hypothetical protein